jgi:hypothetical protein
MPHPILFPVELYRGLKGGVGVFTPLNFFPAGDLVGDPHVVIADLIESPEIESLNFAPFFMGNVLDDRLPEVFLNGGAFLNAHGVIQMGAGAQDKYSKK